MQIGAKIALGDRLVSITIARTWAALSLWQKLKFIGEMLWVGLLVPGKEVNALMDSLTGVSHHSLVSLAANDCHSHCSRFLIAVKNALEKMASVRESQVGAVSNVPFITNS